MSFYLFAAEIDLRLARIVPEGNQPLCLKSESRDAMSVGKEIPSLGHWLEL